MGIDDAQHWHDIFKKEFAKESDRACVILSAAMLDSSLESLLRSRLIPTSASQDDLFDGANAPLSTFDAKINLSHRIGLISSQLCRDLHIIRRIRNQFAHDVFGCSFDNTSVRDRILEIYRSQKITESLPDTRTAFPDGLRGNFQFCVSWMLWFLRTAMGKTEPIEPPPAEFGYDPRGGRRKEKETRKPK